MVKVLLIGDWLVANERLTENIVRNLLRDKGYYDDENIVIEEQSSQNPRIDKLLKGASKSGAGKGYPEFIISFKNKPNDLIVIECKAKITQHESKDRKQYKDYAVDGVLLYAEHLKSGFNVTAIAVSGENEREKKISSFLWLKENYTSQNIQDKTLLTPDEIASIVIEQSKPISENELIKKAIEYNSLLHKYSIPEVERCTLISAILIALQDKPFLNSYQEYVNNKDLIENLIVTCKRVLVKNDLDEHKANVIIDEYSKFKNNVSFNTEKFYNKKKKKDEINTILRDFIILIHENILPYINKSDFDVLGKFYTQFIRYAGSDKKTGLVLTPTHITDFFCEVANLSVDDIVFDECCGTAGFLVSAMNFMLKKAGNNSKKKTKIKSSQLLGIESRSDMFAHACSNMMMRGDGKSHIFYGDCFKSIKIHKEDNDGKKIEQEKKLIQYIKDKYKPTKAFLNPPYQGGNADEQLEFIENALECLVKDGICIAICQMSTTVSSKKEVLEVRKRLLQNHTLEATFSMPDDLFHPIPVNTSILIFKAHVPHSKGKKTFFGYFKDDGLVKTKNKGRIDKNRKWSKIKDRWLNAYINRESIVGLSVTQEITGTDDWCAEAYMKTDFEGIGKKDFEKKVREYLAYKIKYGLTSLNQKEEIKFNGVIDLNTKNWKEFNLISENVFSSFNRGERLVDNERIKGNTPIITAGELDLGVKGFISNEEQTKYQSKITIDMFCNSFCHMEEFCCDDNVIVLSLNRSLNPYMGLFLTTIIEKDKYRYQYGRQYRQKHLSKHKIKLPVDKQAKPDWDFMENYIKSLPYSGYL